MMSGDVSFGFPKVEKLCSLSDIDALFRNGQAALAYPVRCVWQVVTPTTVASCHTCNAGNHRDNAAMKVLISVPKRNHKHAVTRNLLKRRTREAYRLNKHLAHPLSEQLTTQGAQLHVSFTIVSKDVPNYDTIQKAIRNAIQKIVASDLHITTNTPN